MDDHDHQYDLNARDLLATTSHFNVRTTFEVINVHDFLVKFLVFFLLFQLKIKTTVFFIFNHSH